MSQPSLTCPLDVIGVVRTGRTTPESTPVQAALNRQEHGTVDTSHHLTGPPVTRGAVGSTRSRCARG